MRMMSSTNGHFGLEAAVSPWFSAFCAPGGPACTPSSLQSANNAGCSHRHRCAARGGRASRPACRCSVRHSWGRLTNSGAPAGRICGPHRRRCALHARGKHAHASPSPRFPCSAAGVSVVAREAAWSPGSDAPSWLNGSLAGDFGTFPLPASGASRGRRLEPHHGTKLPRSLYRAPHRSHGLPHAACCTPHARAAAAPFAAAASAARQPMRCRIPARNSIVPVTDTPRAARRLRACPATRIAARLCVTCSGPRFARAARAVPAICTRFARRAASAGSCARALTRASACSAPTGPDGPRQGRRQAEVVPAG